mgnify:FL=1
MAFLIIIYFCICIYTLYIWVTLVNRIRQKRYEAAILRAMGFLVLYGFSMMPFLALAFLSDIPFSDMILTSSIFLIIASFFSTSKTQITSPSSSIVPYQPITAKEVQEVLGEPIVTFSPKPVMVPQEVRLLEQQSEYLWSNYTATFAEQFWHDYDQVLVKMKNLK